MNIKRITKRQAIVRSLVAATCVLLTASILKPTLLFLPVYRSVYGQKTQHSFNEARSQLEPTLSFMDIAPLTHPSHECVYSAPPRASFRYLACMQSMGDNRTIDQTDSRELEKWSETAYRDLTDNHWAAAIPDSIYGGDWYQTDSAAIKNLPKEPEYWVKYTKSFDGVACTLAIKLYPEPQSPSERRSLKISLACKHSLRLPFPEGL